MRDERGIEIRAVGGRYKMYTKPQHHVRMRAVIKSFRPPLRLTMPALETLAVIGLQAAVTAARDFGDSRCEYFWRYQHAAGKALITTAGAKR